jgi:hypothetical protein
LPAVRSGGVTPLGAAAASLGVPLTDSLLGVILARTFVAGPFVVITARAGFSTVDERELRRPQTVGYNFVRIFATPGWRNSSQTYSRQCHNDCYSCLPVSATFDGGAHR